MHLDSVHYVGQAKLHGHGTLTRTPGHVDTGKRKF